MKHKSALFVAAILAVLVPAVARAAPVWSLRWLGGTSVLISDTGNSSVSILHPAVVVGAAQAAPVIAQLEVHTSSTAAHPDPVTHQNYLMSWRLTDLSNHLSRVVTVVGYVNGQFAQNDTHLVTNPVGSLNVEHFQLGQDVFSFKVGPTSIKVDSNTVANFSTAHVAVAPVAGRPGDTPPGPSTPPGNGGVHPSPEPGSLTLGGLGFCFFALAAWRRRRYLHLA